MPPKGSRPGGAPVARPAIGFWLAWAWALGVLVAYLAINRAYFLTKLDQFSAVIFGGGG
ncbi:MAG: hypothetical protein ACPGOV_01760 [Magnetovibrionaceae bacterium]